MGSGSMSKLQIIADCHNSCLYGCLVCLLGVTDCLFRRPRGFRVFISEDLVSVVRLPVY